MPPTLTLQFEHQTHQRFHQMLMQYGFRFEVTQFGNVGLLYRHPIQMIEVHLTAIEDDIMAVTSDLTKAVGERINTEESYSTLEWEWIDGAADDEVEFLRRELHILLDVRPQSLTQTPS